MPIYLPYLLLIETRPAFAAIALHTMVRSLQVPNPHLPSFSWQDQRAGPGCARLDQSSHTIHCPCMVHVARTSSLSHSNRRLDARLPDAPPPSSDWPPYRRPLFDAIGPARHLVIVTALMPRCPTVIFRFPRRAGERPRILARWATGCPITTVSVAPQDESLRRRSPCSFRGCSLAIHSIAFSGFSTYGSSEGNSIIADRAPAAVTPCPVSGNIVEPVSRGLYVLPGDCLRTS